MCIVNLMLLNVLDVANPIELDLFQLETFARKMIHNLVEPLITSMSKDREKATIMDYRYQSIEERLHKLEFVLQVDKQKPKIFEDI